MGRTGGAAYGPDQWRRLWAGPVAPPMGRTSGAAYGPDQWRRLWAGPVAPPMGRTSGAAHGPDQWRRPWAGPVAPPMGRTSGAAYGPDLYKTWRGFSRLHPLTDPRISSSLAAARSRSAASFPPANSRISRTAALIPARRAADEEEGEEVRKRLGGG
ncbi:hypothetical protein NQZ68_035777 [Dissostichus eleginoides]|nr:hypothetical protein NQZ68_035777 [Dissostichus eleginoides]